MNGQIVSSISRGLLVLVGIGTEDLPKDAEYCLSKVLGLKLFPQNEEEHWGWVKSVVEAEGEVLCGTSNFLYLREGEIDLYLGHSLTGSSSLESRGVELTNRSSSPSSPTRRKE